MNGRQLKELRVLFAATASTLAIAWVLPALAAPVVQQTEIAATSASSSNRTSTALPTIEFILPVANEVITDYPIHVQVKVTNFELIPPVQYYRSVLNPHDLMKGHIHYSFDDAPTLATDETTLLIEANGKRRLPPGEHVLRAELRALNHKALDPPVFAQTTFVCRSSSGASPSAPLAVPVVNPKITKLRQEVRRLQTQIRHLQEDETEIGKTVGEGNALTKRGSFVDAETKYQNALSLIPEHVAQNHLDDKAAAILRAHILAKLGILYTQEKNYPRATTAFGEAIKLFDDNQIDSPVARKHHAECLKAYAALLRSENQIDKANEVEARAAKIAQ